jgi:hypothetical protein
MQTFLPYSSFERSAEALDYRRLGKQRVEAYQILCALSDSKYGWQNHPAVRMWRGYEDALIAYYSVVCREWISRGYRNTMPVLVPQTDYEIPSWLGDARFHYSHRSNLYRKNSEFYVQWGGIDLVDYVWPV